LAAPREAQWRNGNRRQVGAGGHAYAMADDGGLWSDPLDTMIGGPFSRDVVGPELLDHEDTVLSASTVAGLWNIFIEIGRCWQNLDEDSAGVRSSWLEFIHAKTAQPPSYAGEYCNAVSVVQELVEVYGSNAFALLFLKSGVPDGPPVTRLAHAKRFVVDEFIRMQIVASGFRGFVKPRSLNYNGFIRGSRFNERPRARLYEPEASATRQEIP
jgi:hypothetical protein